MVQEIGDWRECMRVCECVVTYFFTIIVKHVDGKYKIVTKSTEDKTRKRKIVRNIYCVAMKS